MKNHKRISRRLVGLQKILFFIFIFCLFICSSSIYFFFLLPSVVSSKLVETMIEKNVKNVVNIPLEIGDIQFSWSGGLRIRGIDIHGNQLYSQDTILHIDEIAFNILYPAFFRGKIDFQIFVNKMAFHFFRDSDGKTNVDTLMTSQITKKKESPHETTQKTETASFSLPFDIGAKIDIKDMVISAEDQVTNKHLLIENGFFHLNAPSIQSQAIHLNLYMGIALNDRKLPPIELMLTVANIIDPETAAVSPEKIEVSLNGKFPGSTVSVDGSISGKGIKSIVYVDLEELHETVSPFMPANLADSTINGFLNISADVNLQSKDAVSFDTSVILDRINISGPMIQDKAISGFHAQLSNNGKIDLSRRQLEISAGSLKLLQKSSFLYHGTLQGLEQPPQQVFLSLDAVSLDIGELITFGKPFLPDTFPVRFGVDEESPVLTVTGVGLTGNLTTGVCVIKAEKLDLDIPYIQIKDKDITIQVNDTHFGLSQFHSDLKRFFPANILFSSLLNIETVFVDTKEKILVEKISIPKFEFQVDNIEKNSDALLGYSATLAAIQHISIQKIRMPTMGELASVRQTLDVTCRLLPEKKVVVDIKTINLGVTDLMVKNDAIGKFQTSVDMTGSVASMVINSLNPPNLDIMGVKNRIRVGEIAELNITANIRNLAKQRMDTKGELSINLGKLFQKLSKKPKQVLTLGGTTVCKWDIEGRRPDNAEITKLSQGAIADLQKDLAFINHVQTDLVFNQINAKVKLSTEFAFQLENFSAEPLIHYAYNGKNGKGNYSGNLKIHNVESKFIPVDRKPISANFSFSGAHDGLQKITILQNFEINSLNFSESVHLAFSGLDQSILQNKGKNLPYFLKKTGGTFSGRIAIDDLAIINQLQDNIVARGALSAGCELLLVPGSRIGAKTFVHLADINMENGQQFSIQELAGDIFLEKDFLLADSNAAERSFVQVGNNPNLSVSVLKQPDNSGGAAPVRIQRVKGPQTSQGVYPPSEMMIRFAAVSSKKGPLPITLQRFQTGIELVDGLPYVKDFQVDLLGGSIIASVSVQKIDQQFFVPITVSFSGIQTDRFWGKPAENGQEKDTEVSGQFYANLPITTNLSGFLNGIEMDVLFTHIGPLALEQLLYSLDPTESNEKIVSQRKLVKKGFPRWIRLTIMDGSLSLEGVVSAQGVDVDIPHLQRVNIAGLPGLDPLEEGLLKLTPLVKLLRMMSANTIWMDQAKNDIGFIDK